MPRKRKSNQRNIGRIFEKELKIRQSYFDDCLFYCILLTFLHSLMFMIDFSYYLRKNNRIIGYLRYLYRKGKAKAFPEKLIYVIISNIQFVNILIINYLPDSLNLQLASC